MKYVVFQWMTVSLRTWFGFASSLAFCAVGLILNMVPFHDGEMAANNPKGNMLLHQCPGREKLCF
jgi:hypothetical protein